MDCSLPGSSVHGISQIRILEWVAISTSRGSSQPRDWTQVSNPGLLLGRWVLYHWATWEARFWESSNVNDSVLAEIQGPSSAWQACPSAKFPSTKMFVLLPSWLDQEGDIFGKEAGSQKNSKSRLAQDTGGSWASNIWSEAMIYPNPSPSVPQAPWNLPFCF